MLGAQGPQGFQGSQGSQGAQGAKGAQGTQGVAGQPGLVHEYNYETFGKQSSATSVGSTPVVVGEVFVSLGIYNVVATAVPTNFDKYSDAGVVKCHVRAFVNIGDGESFSVDKTGSGEARSDGDYHRDRRRCL